MRKTSISLALILTVLPVSAWSEKKIEVITFSIQHAPIRIAPPAAPIKIDVMVSPPKKVAYASINYRKKGEKAYKTVFLSRGRGSTYSGSIPGSDVDIAGVEYYIFVMDVKGIPHMVIGDPKLPQSIMVSLDAGGDALAGSGKLEEEFAFFATEDVVYGAAKREQKIEEAPASVSVLSEEDIDKLGIYSVTELFRILPGMDVDMLNPSFVLVGTRGYATRGNMNLLLIDGREVNIELLGMPYWDALPVSIFDIKRIEVIRGPASSLYGANAFSGIINIVTKDPGEQTQGSTKIRGGNYKSSFLFADGSGKRDEYSWRVSSEYDHTSRWSDANEPSVDGIKLNARVKRNLGKDADVNMDGGITTGRILAYSNLGLLDTEGNFRYVKFNANWQDLKFQAYWTGTPIDRIRNLSPGLNPPLDTIAIPTITGDLNTYDAYLQYGVPGIPMNRLLIGATGRINTFKMNILPEGENEERRAGVFLQDEFSPVDWVALTLGYRYDWNSVTPPASSPRATLIVSPVKNHTMRASYGLAFRKPNFFEYGFNIKNIMGPPLNVRLSNPDLKNEEMTTYEFGYVARPLEMFSLGLSVYYNQFRKFIEFVPSANNYKNLAADADLYGGELETKIAVSKKARVFLNFSWLRAIDKAKEILPFHINPDKSNPRYKAVQGLEWGGLAGLFGSLSIIEVAGYTMAVSDPNTTLVIIVPQSKIVTVDPYTLVNAKLGYKFAQDRFEVGVYGQNLLFKKHREFPGTDWERKNIVTGETVGHEIYGGEEIGTKILGFVGARF